MTKKNFNAIMDVIGDVTSTAIPVGSKIPVFVVKKLAIPDAVNVSVGDELAFYPCINGGWFNRSNGMRCNPSRNGQVRVSGIEFERWETV